MGVDSKEEREVECPECDGSGYVVCEACDGSGKVEEYEEDDE